MCDKEELKMLFKNMGSFKLNYYTRLLKVPSKLKKADKIEALVNEYTKENFVKNIYDSLEEYEKEVLDFAVNYCFDSYQEDIDEIRLKYSLKKLDEYIIEDFVSEDRPVYLISSRNMLQCKFIQRELRKLVPLDKLEINTLKFLISIVKKT